MNLSYKFNKDNTEGAKGEASTPPGVKGAVYYGEAAHVRNVCFILNGGRKKFLNYAYLIDGEFLPEENTIILTFTTSTITLKGHRLDLLFHGFLTHGIQEIAAEDERYAATEETESIVTDIAVQNL